MRILFLTRKFYPSVGGVENHVMQIAKELVKTGYRVVVISEQETEEKKIEEESNINGVKIYKIPVVLKRKLRKFEIWKWFFKNIALIKSSEVIHCHDVFFWYLPFRLLFPKKRVYVTFHGWEGKFPVPKRYILSRKIWEKLSWGNICVGDYLKKWYGTKTNFVTYGGIRKNKQKITFSDLENKKIIFGPRLDLDVGTIEYLKAIRMLKKVNKDLIFVYFGRGSMEKKAGDLGNLLGYVKNPSYYIQGSRLVYASSYLVILEALNFKRLSFVVINNELKRDMFTTSPFAKFTTLCSNSKEIFDKTIYFLNHPEGERKLVERGFRWAKEQTWEKVADLYLELWGSKNKEENTENKEDGAIK